MPPTKNSGLSQPSVTSASVTVGNTAAVGITGRSRIGARALRPDFEQAALIDPGDAAAAGADLDEIERRRRDQPLAGLKARHDARLAVLDDAGLGRRSAHVERDDFELLGHAPDMRRAEHARRRSGLDHAHRNAFERAAGETAAVGLHDVERLGDAPRLERFFELVNVAIHHRRDVGVHHRGRQPRVLADLRQRLAG